jgi:hypothetical protein
MLAAIASTGTVAFCNDQPDNQKSAQMNTQVEVQMSYLFY